MGTHISKVKSVDLDVWTPEQMTVSLHLYVFDGVLISAVFPCIHSQFRNGVIVGRISIGKRISEQATFPRTSEQLIYIPSTSIFL